MTEADFDRAPPSISVADYVNRFATYLELSMSLLLSVVLYLDRLSTRYPTFILSSLKIYRFLISTATVVGKGFSDRYCSNYVYARDGSITTLEFALLELDLLQRSQWHITPRHGVLEEYYRGPMKRTEGYEIAYR
ncbi:uncharacterized protein PV09_09697 [Verruconis gallopava]|uniref:Cyclin n=1 Tax=Verruconis gallopava TaxID=253628 RepID=A0A0D1X8Y6_9PEZI|nr:uncharacterized protein PV09_09697 [Verruconis gallopava]KIV98495.1 hypothetical protein PV09_09697 [Verruconis gallopava]